MQGGPFAAWLDAKQARRNDEVPAALRGPEGARLVRRADTGLVITALGGLVWCVVLGLGAVGAVTSVAATAVVLIGLVLSAGALRRLGRLEPPTAPSPPEFGPDSDADTATGG